MNDLLSHAVFRAAVEEMSSLGIEISLCPNPGAIPYAVVSGRSNARWWLIPLQPKQVSLSGFALFQPLLRSAQIIKAAVGLLTRLGLSRLWVRQTVYISGIPSVDRHFSRETPLHFAYFTGTDSPHRKLAIQIMGSDGELKGFAKVTRNPQVRPLIEHEAKTLVQIRDLNLKSAQVPTLLFLGAHQDATILVTDTLKTPATGSTNTFSAAHRAFVQELKDITGRSIRVGDIAGLLSQRLDHVTCILSPLWRQRIATSIRYLEARSHYKVSVGLTHGDFTPWNTFMANGRLYVFDWEYAEDALPPTNDVIHFILNQPSIRDIPAHAKMEAALTAIGEPIADGRSDMGYVLGLIYLLTHALRQIERLPPGINQVEAWDGCDESAAMFDYVIEILQQLP